MKGFELNRGFDLGILLALDGKDCVMKGHDVFTKQGSITALSALFKLNDSYFVNVCLAAFFL